MNFSPKPHLFIYIFYKSLSYFTLFQKQFLCLFSTSDSQYSLHHFPQPSPVTAFSHQFATLTKAVSPSLFSNLPNPSLYNDEELVLHRSLKISPTSHKKLSSHCIASYYRLFRVTTLQFNVKNRFTVIRPVFLQKLYQ